MADKDKDKPGIEDTGTNLAGTASARTAAASAPAATDEAGMLVTDPAATQPAPNLIPAETLETERTRSGHLQAAFQHLTRHWLAELRSIAEHPGTAENKERMTKLIGSMDYSSKLGLETAGDYLKAIPEEQQGIVQPAAAPPLQS